MVFSRVSRRGHRGGQVGNGRKWQKMAENGGKKDHRGYLVGNGFSRVLRLFPTTILTRNKWFELPFALNNTILA